MLEEDIKKIHKEFDFSKRMLPLTKKEQSEFEKAKICWICQKKYSEKDRKVRDHDHFTGKFRGAAHNSCNLQFKKPKFTPVIFHNLSGYDAHLFVKNLGTTEGNIKCIPNNEEKYISFSKEIVVGEYEKDGKKHEIKHEIRFLDSFKFMASSLDSLAGNLSKSDLSKFIHLKNEFEEKYELLAKKGIYPYDYMNRIERFSEKKNFHQKRIFIQSRMIAEFQMKNMGGRERSGKNLQSKILGNIMIFISKVMFCFLQMFLRSFEIFVWKIILWIQHGIIPPLVYLGMLC